MSSAAPVHILQLDFGVEVSDYHILRLQVSVVEAIPVHVRQYLHGHRVKYTSATAICTYSLVTTAKCICCMSSVEMDPCKGCIRIYLGLRS